MHEKGQETHQRSRKGGGGGGYAVLIQHGQNPNTPLAKMRHLYRTIQPFRGLVISATFGSPAS